MARYIDTSKVTIPEGFFEDLNVPKLLQWLNNQPAADVVEVVRCKDCIYHTEHHYEEKGEKPYIKIACKWSNYSRQLNDYCSLGERRE